MEPRIKILLTGDSEEGLTAIFNRFHVKQFDEEKLKDYKFNIAFNNVLHKSFKFIFIIWKLGNDLLHKNSLKSFFPAAGAIIAFNENKKSSFDNMEKWVDAILNNSNIGLIPIIVVGYKEEKTIQIQESVDQDIIINFCKNLSLKLEKIQFLSKYFSFSDSETSKIDDLFNYLADYYMIRKDFFLFSN